MVGIARSKPTKAEMTPTISIQSAIMGMRVIARFSRTPEWPVYNVAYRCDCIAIGFDQETGRILRKSENNRAWMSVGGCGVRDLTQPGGS